MGVRGLTSFIAKNSDKYMKAYELHSGYLIIDGNNLAVQLYRWHAKCLDCFGGDYDQYAHAVRTFFENLRKCNITPLVVFDGCYELKKLKTIYMRTRDRVSASKKYSAVLEQKVFVFPLYLRELFTEIVISTGCKVFRCDFEADYEMACLAKTINAPLLSYDSDFYIFDILYIPFNELDSKPRIKTSENRIYLHTYLKCNIYIVENFLKSVGGMDKGVLPLLATVLGNDYIAAGVFKEFYAQLKMVNRRRMDSEQHRKIESVIKWFLNETYESAAKKILARVKRDHRPKLANQMEEVAKGYQCSESKLLQYFGVGQLCEQSSVRVERTHSQIDLSTINDDIVESSALCDYIEEELGDVEAPGELNLDQFDGHFPEWFMDQYHSCNFPAWFMDIAVHNRYIFIPQLESFEQTHSHTISLELLSAMHKILRSNLTNEKDALRRTELTYVSRQGHNFIMNSTMPFCTLSLPTLNEIPGMTATELRKNLHKIVGMADSEVNDFLTNFSNEWKLYILAILFWAKHISEVNKMHIYALVLCGITLNTVSKKIGYVRTIKELNRKSKQSPSLAPYLNFMDRVIPYFYKDERMLQESKRHYIYTVDRFARFQSALFHLKYLNKLLLVPYDDFLISDFYNGTFIYNIFTTLQKRADPLTYLKNMCGDCMDIFNQFLQIAVEITYKLDNIADGNRKLKKKKNQHQGSNNKGKEENKYEEEVEIIAGSSYDPNNSYSVLSVE